MVLLIAPVNKPGISNHSMGGSIITCKNTLLFTMAHLILNYINQGESNARDNDNDI